MFNDAPNIVSERKTFTIAHEIGHIVMGHFNLFESNVIAQQYSRVNSSLIEREANYFAACILCPMPIVHKLQPASISEIQQYFNLSYEASVIAWNDYINYDRNYHIAWHNDMIRLFSHINYHISPL